MSQISYDDLVKAFREKAKENRIQHAIFIYALKILKSYNGKKISSRIQSKMEKRLPSDLGVERVVYDASRSSGLVYLGFYRKGDTFNLPTVQIRLGDREKSDKLDYDSIEAGLESKRKLLDANHHVKKLIELGDVKIWLQKRNSIVDDIDTLNDALEKAGGSKGVDLMPFLKMLKIQTGK